MKNEKKPTESIHVHWIDPELGNIDDWYIVRKNNDYTVSFFFPQAHEAWLGKFDLNRRQYDFYCFPCTREEAEIISRWRKRRNKRGAGKPPVMPAGHLKFSPQEVMFLSLKKIGLTNQEIADEAGCSEDKVKQFFSRRSRALGCKGAIAMLERLKMARMI